MLSLKKKEGAVLVCHIQRGHQKPVPVWYYFDVDDSLLHEVDDYEALLKTSLPKIKTKLRINQETVSSALKLIQAKKEPAEDEKGPVRRAYYVLQKRAKELLREEIDLRDVADKAQINLPSTLDEWPGTEFIAGSSGSGKGWYCTTKILRHWKTTTPRNRRHVFWISPELLEDVTLRRISDVKKFEPWFHGIDVSFAKFEGSGLSKEDFFAQHVKAIVQHQKNSIIVCDDFVDCPFPNIMRRWIDRMLRTGRHQGTSTWTLQHSLRNSHFSRQSVQSCKLITLFARSQRGKCITFLKDSVGLGLSQCRELISLMSESGRSATLRMHSPMCLVCDNFVKLL